MSGRIRDKPDMSSAGPDGDLIMEIIDPDVLRQCLHSSLLSPDHRTRISYSRLIVLLSVQALYKTELLLYLIL